MNMKKEKIMESIKEQLEKQDAMGHLPIYEKIVDDEYAIIEQQIKAKYSGIDTKSITIASVTKSFPRGGEVIYSNAYGSNYYGKTYIQYIAPDETAEIINDYLHGKLTTLDDLLKYLLGTGLSAKFKPISVAIMIYGGLEFLDSFLTSNTIRDIESGTGASKTITVDTSYNQSTVWVEWDTYDSVSIPSESLYIKDVTYEIY